METFKHKFFIARFIDEMQKPKYKDFVITLCIDDTINELCTYTFCKYFLDILENENPTSFHITLRRNEMDFTIEFTKDSGIFVYTKFDYSRIKIESFNKFIEMIQDNFKIYLK